MTASARSRSFPLRLSANWRVGSPNDPPAEPRKPLPSGQIVAADEARRRFGSVEPVLAFYDGDAIIGWLPRREVQAALAHMDALEQP